MTTLALPFDQSVKMASVDTLCVLMESSAGTQSEDLDDALDHVIHEYQQERDFSSPRFSRLLDVLCSRLLLGTEWIEQTSHLRMVGNM